MWPEMGEKGHEEVSGKRRALLLFWKERAALPCDTHTLTALGNTGMWCRELPPTSGNPVAVRQRWRLEGWRSLSPGQHSGATEPAPESLRSDLPHKQIINIQIVQATVSFCYLEPTVCGLINPCVEGWMTGSRAEATVLTFWSRSYF